MMLKKLLLEIIWPDQIKNIIWTGPTLDPLINVESMFIIFEDFASTHSSFIALSTTAIMENSQK